MNNIVNNAINNKIFNAAIGTIDIAALAKELEPEIRKEIKRNIISYVKEAYWGDIFGDKADTILSEFALAALKKGLNGETTTKHSEK